MEINLKGSNIYLPFEELADFSSTTVVHLTDESL